MVTDARTGCCAALLCETKHTTETLNPICAVVHIRNRTNTHTDTNGRRKSNESPSESSIRTNWNPDIHESSILEWKSWSDRAMHTDTLGTTSNLTNTEGRQIFGVADSNDSPDCRFGHPTCFLDSDTETVMYAEQTKVLPKHAFRFNSGIWVGRCTISNAHLVVDGNKLFRTRTVRRFPEGSERWNHETMQRFEVNVTNPTSIPDIPSKRAERQHHASTSSTEPSGTEFDRHKKRKRDPDDNGISVRRKYDEEGDAEFAELLLENGLMMTRTTDTFEPQYIGHDERILQEPYVEPIQVFPILHEPKLDATRTGGLNEKLVSKAMKAEMESFRKFDVYDEVDIDDLTPEERSKIIGGRWVLTPKSDTVVKARYVAQGYAQYVEPDAVCATTLSPTTLRLCLTLALQRRYHMQTWDVSTAFLHATRSEEEPIYLRPPMEFYDEESTLWRVKRAVYGLKTSPREWQDCFARTLTKKLGMTRSRIDANLFTKTIGNELVMILVYVDDPFILGPHDESNEMLKLLQEHFTMKQTGELTEGSEVQFLGRTIKRDLDSISFSTSTNYVTALVDLLDITDNRERRITGSSSPVPKSDDTNSLNPADHSRYRRAVGMLQWIVPTRPDMAFATKERARALASPTNADMTALRHLVRYYRTTSDLELRIQPKTRTRVPEGEPELLSVEAYSDSDWAGCRDTRRSTSGGMIYFEGAVLSFWSRTQTTAALSSCEAELYAINMATIEALNVKSTIEELIKNCKTNITEYTDSSSAKSITSRRGVTRKTKHIELRQLFVQDLVANGTLQVTKV